jgi:hypothetical protein
MRARKVYESVGFQRGADPLKSLDLGLKSIKDLGPLRKRPVHVWRKGNEPYQTSRGYLLWKLLNYINTQDLKGEPVGYADCVRYYYTVLKGEGPRRTFSIGAYNALDGYINKNGSYSLNHYGKAYLDHFDIFDDGRDTIQENYQFERGADPKKSLGIGQWRDGYLIEKDTDRHGDQDFINRLLDFSDYQWDKNPTDVSGISGETEVTPELAAELDHLPVVTFRYFKNEDGMLGLLDDWPEDFPFRRIPFIANVEEDEGRTFLIDTSGYAYARYITELV